MICREAVEVYQERKARTERLRRSPPDLLFHQAAEQKDGQTDVRPYFVPASTKVPPLGFSFLLITH